MNSKTLMLGLAVIGASTGVFAGEQMEVVTIKSQDLLMQSKRGQALRTQLEQEANRLQEYQQQLSADLRAKSEDFQKNSKIMTPEAQNEAILNLKMAERRSQRKLQEMQEDTRLMAQNREETVRRGLITVATNMLEEENWGAVIDASQRSLTGVVATNSKLDVTDKVLAKADALYEEEMVNNQVTVAQTAGEQVIV